MNDVQGYAVFFFPKAIEALGGAIEPYLLGEKGGEHVLCREVDTGGAFTKMVLDGRTPQGTAVELELMIPGSMVRMIVSARSEEAFGFGPRVQTALPAQAIVSDAPVPAAQAPAKQPADRPAKKAAKASRPPGGQTAKKATKKTAKKAATKPAGRKKDR
ncbi:hypothetical protein [Marilutibacter spongiae]|uniref:Uncharacterized protein n=1 Tax=Marilutibacter spongiae TaxID=2025720 RepID=A0A7W3Y6Y2_9GAMM|nr:hypothetical protein [Lysobacter spongiae]MBB1061396.1 hypothetical protein [Lysobacter spongiae]